MQAFVENFFQALVAGILNGSIYGLMCVGLGLIFGVMRVINFAQGEFLMLGMYATLYIVTALGFSVVFGPYVGPFVAAVFAGLLLSVGGYLLHRYLVSRVTGVRAIGAEGEGHYAQLILTLGVSLVLQNGGLILFGSTPQSLRTPLSASAWEVVLPLSRCRRVRQQGAHGGCIDRDCGDRAACSGSSIARDSARRCAPPPTIRKPRCTWASMSIARIASRSASALASRRWRAVWWRPTIRSSRTSGSSS